MKEVLPKIILALLTLTFLLTNCSEEERIYFFRFPELPSVVTFEPENVTTNTAYLSGKILSAGSGAIIESGIHIYISGGQSLPGPSPIPEFLENRYSGNTAEGYFSVFFNDLRANTTYFYRAFATNNTGTSYGDLKILITPDDNISGITEED